MGVPLSTDLAEHKESACRGIDADLEANALIVWPKSVDHVYVWAGSEIHAPGHGVYKRP